MRRQLDVALRQLMQGLHSRWSVRLLKQTWGAWRGLWARAQQALLEAQAQARVDASDRLRERGAAAAETDVRRARGETKRAERREEELIDELSLADARLEASAAATAAAQEESLVLAARVTAAEAVAAERSAEAEVVDAAYMQAKRVQAVWFEEREALLTEVEAARAEKLVASELVDRSGLMGKAFGGAWQNKVADLTADHQPATTYLPVTTTV